MGGDLWRAMGGGGGGDLLLMASDLKNRDFLTKNCKKCVQIAKKSLYKRRGYRKQLKIAYANEDITFVGPK